MFGLLGEGVLPTADLDLSLASVEQALAGSSAPTAVLTRSRSRGDADNPPRWLPDTLITQIWCNRAMMTGLGLEEAGFQDSTLLELLPRFVHAHHTSISNDKLVMVDGTSLLPSSFDMDGEEDGRKSNLVGNAAAADGGSLYIGTIDHALVREEINDGAVSIGTALWPPPYVLETAALENGLVIVNNVNCGYLDFATNFLLAARKVVSDVKVSPNYCFGRIHQLYPAMVSCTFLHLIKQIFTRDVPNCRSCAPCSTSRMFQEMNMAAVASSNGLFFLILHTLVLCGFSDGTSAVVYHSMQTALLLSVKSLVRLVLERWRC